MKTSCLEHRMHVFLVNKTIIILSHNIQYFVHLRLAPKIFTDSIFIIFGTYDHLSSTVKPDIVKKCSYDIRHLRCKFGILCCQHIIDKVLTLNPHKRSHENNAELLRFKTEKIFKTDFDNCKRYFRQLMLNKRCIHLH